MGPPAPTEPFPYKEFAQLLQRNDPLEISTALLLWGKAGEAETRLTTARKDGLIAESEDYWNTLAAIYVAQGRFQEALPLLAQVLRQRSTHPQAHWNRAKALEGLGLTLSASREYEAVSQLEPTGSGWALEAQRHVARLAPNFEVQSRWKKVLAAGDALIDARVLPPPDLNLANSAIARLFFYEAVRTRQSVQDVQALLPLASVLDPSGVLSRYTEGVAAREFKKRAPLAQQYKTLWKAIRQGTGMTPQLQQTAAALLSCQEDDLAIGAAILLPQERQSLQVLEERVAKLRDPWFDVMLGQRRAAAARAQGDLRGAQRALTQALDFCAKGTIPYRCMDAEFDMAIIQSSLSELDVAQTHAEKGLTLAFGFNEHGKGLQLIELIAQIAKLRNDVPVARAYLEEAVQRARDDKPSQHHIHQTLMNLALQELDFASARQELNLALATGEPLTLAGAMDLADIARHLPDAGDEAAFLRAMEVHRANASPGQQALWQHALGRFYLALQRESGRTSLQDTLRDMQKRSPQELELDQDLQRALAGSYHELILDQGRLQDFPAALELFAQEQGFSTPARCAVALTEERERSLLIVRGASGETWGRFEGNRSQRLPQDMTGILPGEALAMLRGCTQIEVITRPPLYDRRNVLPPEMAWSYHMRAVTLQPDSGPGQHLIVSDVKYQQVEGQKREQLRWTPASGVGQKRIFLQGWDATPTRVLQAMVDATEIDLVTHGDKAQASNSSFLVLAPEPTGEDRLTVARLRQMANLKRAPFVVIAACEGGHTSPISHEAVSIPAMLLRKGARGVLAATVVLNDTAVNTVVNAVREEMYQGKPPAIALRDVRQRWLAEHKDPEASEDKWIDHILLFE
ncbi:CHAT domain-containing protein [Hyalangium versicolor]|uniref:CHAT domain-containing protein n=1 Tax=Hyalangium versicolor TaxID=2861190 RepID=UPI001CCAC197|nr:CHAT domain-containing protein [Hyalangium versicolor]